MGARGAGRLEPPTPPTGLHLTLPHCPLSRSGPDPALCTPKLLSLKLRRQRKDPCKRPPGCAGLCVGGALGERTASQGRTAERKQRQESDRMTREPKRRWQRSEEEESLSELEGGG